jgi:hypothetical protein
MEATPAAAQVTTQVFSNSTIAVQSSNSSSTYGDAITFTATVSAGSPGLGFPTGTVQFVVDGGNLGAPVTLVNGQATSPPTSTLGAGAHTVSAAYSGDSFFDPTTSADITQVVNPATLNVAADNQTINHGDAVPSLTYTISGFVNDEDASVVSGAAALTTAATSTSPAGHYPITVGAGTLSAVNYTFNLVSGILTVQPTILDVRLDYGSKSISLIGLNRDLPFTTLKAIDIIFSDNVAVSMGELALTGSNVPSYSFSGFSYNPGADDATWTLPTALGVDKLMMALDGATFAGDPIIGVNPFGAKFSVLPGDINGDGVVNSQDLVLERNAIQGTGDPSMLGWADVDGNGVVDLNDFMAVRKRLGTHF